MLGPFRHFSGTRLVFWSGWTWRSGEDLGSKCRQLAVSTCLHLLAVITLVWLLNVPKSPFPHLLFEENNRVPLLCLLPGLALISDCSTEHGAQHVVRTHWFFSVCEAFAMCRAPLIQGKTDIPEVKRLNNLLRSH